ncbi:MAG: right-handed parallel beta-helix repeat-containing protein [Bacteroidota bacterium]
MKKLSLIFLLNFIVFSACAHAQESEATDENLSPMNRVAMDLYVDFTNDVDGETFRILLIGNSITLHGKAEDIGWFIECGMAASSVEKDYAHRLFRKLEGLMPDRKIHMRLTNSASFERDVVNYDIKTIDRVKMGFKPDVIVFQLSENVPSDTDLKIFEEKYATFINKYKKGNKAVTLCTTPFFPSAERTPVIRRVAKATNSFLVDLSSLVLLDEENYAKNEKDYPLDKSKWKVDGIGIHPGDYGMENIADLMFTTINAALKSLEKHTPIYVRDFGIYPNSDNNHDALVRLFDSVKKMKKPVEVLFEPNAVYRMGLKNGDESNDQKHALVVDGIDNLIINGQGASFLITNPEIGSIKTENCNHIEVKNFNIDYVILPYTQGVVTAVNTDEYWFELKLDKGYPEPDLPHFENSKIRDANWGLTIRELKNGRRAYGPTAVFSDKWKQTGKGVWRFYPKTNWAGYNDPLVSSGLKVGEKYVHMARNWNTGVAAVNCENILWENIVVYAAPGLTFFPHQTSYHTIRNCHTKIKKGRIFSTNADGIHMRGSRGHVLIEGCSFKGMADDGINLHSSALSIQGQPTPNQVLVKKHTFSVRVGDELVLVRSSQGKILAEVIVKSAEDKGDNWLITLDKDLPTVIAGKGFESSDNLYNMSEIATPFIIRNCQFKDYRGRGILVSTQGGVIENNVFNLNEGWGVVFVYESSVYAEGPFAEDVIVRNNEFCAFELGSNPAILSHISTQDGSKAESRLFRNIKIENNKFYDYACPVVQLQSANGVTINSNVSVCSDEIPRMKDEYSSIILHNCENVSVDNFRIKDFDKRLKAVVEISEDCEKGESITVKNLNLDVVEDVKAIFDKRRNND